MKRFSLLTLLLVVGLLSLAIALFIRFPGPMILCFSFMPLVVVLRNVTPGKTPSKEIQLIVVVALAAIPPYLAAGPFVAGGA